MRLFHVSEEPDIQVFEPRLPKRKDLDPDVGLVWAIDEKHLPNFLTPRDCPRVCYHVGNSTVESDVLRFLPQGCLHAVVMENKWLPAVQNTTLYVYEFSPNDFELLDPVAGYYIARNTQRPIGKTVICDLLGELRSRNIEVRFEEGLWEIAEAVKRSSLDWSLCRMANAAPKNRI